ncbi:PAS domain-containing protein [Halomicroarcula sp. GCM10025709]|uniref:PAS domain-containing protein n=1 Tax=Halomicroarcula sp. GCM10025709 TaxID=3252669 RepID=UPI003605ED42
MDDGQGTSAGGPLFAESTDRIELLFDHDRNGELLGEWLSESFTVGTATEPRLDESTDLCLVDTVAFARHETALRAWKRASAPVFAPVLLVSEAPVSEQFDPEEWRTIDGLYVVDDVIATPIEKPVLHRRLANLLERRALSERLDSRYRHSEQRFASLFTTLPDPAFVSDPEGTLLFVNDAFCATVGTDRERAVGSPLAALSSLDDETTATLEQCLGRAIGDDALAVDQIELTAADGEGRHLELNATATAIDDEQFVTVVLRDVTERVRQTDRLEESERRFRRIATHLNEVIWMLDADGELLYISPGYEAMTGRPLDNLHGSPLETALEHVHPDDEDHVTTVMEAMFDDLQAGTVDGEYHFEYRLVDRDGTVRWIQSDAYPVDTPNGESRRLVGLLDDVTERKRRERSLERQNDRLRSSRASSATTSGTHCRSSTHGWTC